jgi:hypothetical protein
MRRWPHGLVVGFGCHDCRNVGTILWIVNVMEPDSVITHQYSFSMQQQAWEWTLQERQYPIIPV